MTPRFTAHARDDLRAILSYIERQSPQGATNVARAMRKTAELIGQFPEAVVSPASNAHASFR